MRIYHPVRGVGGALREDSFAIIDDAGVEIGQGGLTHRLLKKMLPDRPLDIELNMHAHPAASDTLFGALCARAESIKEEQGGHPARLYTRCAIDDAQRHEYFTRMGFDDFDGDELFVLHVPQDMRNRRRNYSPMGTKAIDVDLRTRARREEFLLGLKDFGYVEHASEWLEERMKEPVFIARAMYYGSDFVGQMLVTGNQNEAVLEMICVESKWRGKGVACALIDEALMQLSSQNVPYLRANSVRRNTSAMQMFRRAGFEWIRTDCYLLGRDM
ncbi:MAG: GNAT family N-acetyltransferase [Eubacteriales bacterium]|nr:GNAT family N-acetyltransferase [Eubacteriales bacterium]